VDLKDLNQIVGDLFIDRALSKPTRSKGFGSRSDAFDEEDKFKEWLKNQILRIYVAYYVQVL
jgi:hypothetical protein